MQIKKALRSRTSYCRICGRLFNRGDKYVKLDGSFRVMRGLMCIDHLNIKNCDGCSDRLGCLTDNKMTICVAGGIKSTKVSEI